MNLSKLTKKRRDHVRSCKNNSDASHNIIANLYSELSHFIYELLQNADDALASTVFFNLTNDFLEVSHNGKREFNYKDVEAITTIGSSTKPDDINAIGRFGAGFKSVFAITKTPCIHSGQYHFKIVDYIVPEEIKPIKTNGNTIIILPFNNEDFLSKQEIYNNISHVLRILRIESLLFLNNVEKIEWEIDQEIGCYFCSRTLDTDVVSITKRVNKQESSYQYFIFNKKVTLGIKPLTISIAYQRGGDKIIPIINFPLFVFFPTEVKPGFKFLVHIPYKTTPSRETVPFEDSENKKLTQHFTELVLESILKIKELGFLDVDFLALLPIDSNNPHPIYKEVFTKLQQLFKEYPLLPTTNALFSKPQDSLIASSKELTELLNQQDNYFLFQKHNWLDLSISSDRDSIRVLRSYIEKILDVRSISPSYFFNHITKQFIENKPDEWLIKFYKFAQKNSYLYPQLTRTPIIRLDNGSHINPKDDQGEPQAYFPREQISNFKTIKNSLISDEDIKQFLSNLGLKEPDDLDEIKSFIVPKYKSKSYIDKVDYLKDFEMCFSLWQKNSDEKQQEIIDLLNNLYFVGCVDLKNNFNLEIGCNDKRQSWYQTAIIYYHSDELEKWFEGNTETKFFFLINELEDKKYKTFLSKLGIKDSLFLENSEVRDKQSHGYYEKGLEGFNPYFNIHGLAHSIKNINLIRSVIIWSVLLYNANTNKFKGRIQVKTKQRDDWSVLLYNANTNKFKGRIQVKTKQRDEWKLKDEELSSLLQSLLNSYWLFDKNGILIESLPQEISVDDLHQDYNQKHQNFDKVVSILGLIPNTNPELEKLKNELQKSEKEKSEAIKRADQLEKEKNAETERANQAEEKLRKHGININDNIQTQLIEESSFYSLDSYAGLTTYTVDESLLQPIPTKDLSGQSSNYQNMYSKDYQDNKNHNLSRSNLDSISVYLSKAKAKEIGDIGEYHAEQYLKEKYRNSSVINWNLLGNGEGYDFKIIENGEEICYYEVKSKLDENQKSFNFTASQWSFATYLYDKNQGDKYIVLLVSNLLVSNLEKSNVILKELKNPVKLWKERRLKAQRIEITWE